jgi:hypothetical protein
VEPELTTKKKAASPVRAANSALRTQVGGSHYNTLRIQPMEYILANNIRFPEGSVIKYVTRWQGKNGIEDLRKARQTIDVIIEDALANGWPEAKAFRKPKRTKK